MKDVAAETTSEKLFRNQVDDLYKSLGYTNVAVILISSFLAWILWPVAANSGLVPWYACIVVLNLWSMTLALLYKRARVAEDNIRGWLKTYMVSGFLSGLCWGSLLLFVVPPAATIHLLATIFIMAGLVTAAAASLSSLKYGFAVFSVPAILPGALYLIYLNQSITFLLGCMLITFLVFIMFIALRIHRTLFYSLRKQVEVSNKLSQLEVENTELAQKVDGLKHKLELDQAELEQLRSTLRHKSLPGAGLRRTHDFRDMRFVSLLDQLTGGVWDLNMKTGDMSFSPGWLDMLGYSEDIAHKHLDFWSGLLHPDDRLGVLNKLHAFADGNLSEFVSSHRLRSSEGQWVWVMARAHGVIWGSFGELLNIAGMELHVPESREAAGRSLDLLNFDINAWLVSPDEFRKRYLQLVATASLAGIEHSLCHIRIVRLHDAQDDLPSLNEIRLYEVGRVLLNEFRHGDALMRLGEDSFALLMAFCKPDDAWDKAMALQHSLQRLQVNFKGAELPLVVGIGITPVMAGSEDMDSLLEDARTACGLAISGSSSLIYLYQRDNLQLGADLFERHLVRNIQDAGRSHNIHIRATPLQPLAAQGEPQSEAAGQIVVVSTWLEEEGKDEEGAPTLRNSADSLRRQRLDISIDVNVIGNIMAWLEQDDASRVYFHECSEAACLDAKFLDLLCQQLRRLPKGSATLCLGVPQTVLSAQPQEAAHFIQTLRAAGARIALTQFSNPASVTELLRNCPVDYIKLDAALLQNLGQDPSAGINIKYINDLIHLAGVKSIVNEPGHDTAPELLQALGIDFMDQRPALAS
jgi:EAL domain-containing protein (putative c-di-GMP-specific phosphodiesterase class I)/PAS domain-containing protein